MIPNKKKNCNFRLLDLTPIRWWKAIRDKGLYLIQA